MVQKICEAYVPDDIAVLNNPIIHNYRNPVYDLGPAASEA